MRQARSLFFVLSAAVSIQGGGALADPAPSVAPDWAAWQTAAARFVPAECAEILRDFLAVRQAEPEESRGAPLVRADGPLAADMLARLAATGGIPYIAMNGRLVRRASVLEDGMWRPRAEGTDAQINRGHALLDVGGRTMLVIDHMPSPITSASSIWEVAGKKVVMRAELPGEIVSVEDRPDRLVLHVTDTLTAERVAWDKAGERFVGVCFAATQAPAMLTEEVAAAVSRSIPAALTVVKGRRRPLYAQLAADDVPAYEVGKVAGGARGAALYTHPDGWVLALLPLVDKTPAMRIFRALPDRMWQVGWLAPDAVAAP